MTKEQKNNIEKAIDLLNEAYDLISDIEDVDGMYYPISNISNSVNTAASNLNAYL